VSLHILVYRLAKKVSPFILRGEKMEERKIEYKNHPTINSVTHKFKGIITWEKALEQVINNRLKSLKLLD